MYKRLPIDKKIELIKHVQSGESISQVCHQAGVSRTAFYSWLKKYQQSGPRAKKKALVCRVVRGNRHWKKLSSATERKVLKICLKNPLFSPKKISQLAGVSSHGVWNILKRYSLNTRQNREVYISQHGTSLIGSPNLNDKLTMIRRFEAGEKIAHICREFGISRTAFYKWLNRYQQAAGEDKRQALNSWRPKGESHWRFVPGAKELIFKIVAQHPELTPEQISKRLFQQAGQPVLGNHGIYNVLKRYGLNTYAQRLAYSQTQQAELSTSGITAWTDRIKLVWDKFIPTRAPAGPPGFAISKLLNLQTPKLLQYFFLGLILAPLVSLPTLYWFRMFSQAPTFSSKLGFLFASIALAMGSFFFIYSFKYYLTLAIVLSFSRHSLEEGEGFSFSLTAGFNGKKGNFHNNANGKTTSLFAWLGRVFGVSLDNGNGLKHSGKQPYYNNNGNDVLSGFAPTAGVRGGLQASLDHIELKHHPFVSIHLPLYNEKRVVKRILEACTSMTYSNFEIIVCDDSNDETVGIIDKFVSKYRKTHPHGPKIKVLRRPSRQGFKGAALANALKHTDPRAEFISVFDADFVPYPDTLELFLKYFQVNNQDNIAVVGGYQWHVLNKSENWITR
ncbi:glycosyltransferase, partial [Patescibacteria group bacterium]|nr:glycosyltransferase [Patescibacteria group bacterium]MBU1931882.1 glycosyltransferase [Patescibacteria group bacterium]